MNKAKILFNVIIGFPIYYLSKAFPKDKKIAVIGSSLGKYFSDNSKYYYIKHYDSEISKKEESLIWISKNKNVVLYLKSLGLPARNLYSFGGIYTVLRASKAYLSHQLTDINGPLLGGAQIVQLWHGMALRKIGYGADWFDNSLKGNLHLFISKWFPYAYYMKCDVLYAPCQLAKENSIEPFSKSFRNGKIEENIHLVRQARTLCFDNSFKLDLGFFPEINLLEELSEKYNRIISWLPTHRTVFKKSILDIISDSNLDLIELNRFCKSSNSLFVIKAHFLDFEKISSTVKDLDFVLVYPYPDPYPLLRHTDILITDYSSVFFDFLILNRPIVFMAHDLEEYTKRMNFYYKYEELNIGEICNSWKDTIKVLNDNFKGNDKFIKQRKGKLEELNFVSNYDIV